MADRKKIRSGPTLLFGAADWFGSAAALITANFIALDLFTSNGKPTIAGAILCGLLVITALGHLWKQIGKKHSDLPVILEGPLLLTVGAWALFRIGASSVPHLLFLPAATLAWISVRSPLWVKIFCWIVAISMEAGLTASGGQPMVLAVANLSVCLAATAALLFFPGSKMYRFHLEKDREANEKELNTKQQASELGLDSCQPSVPEFLEKRDDQESFGRQIDKINTSFELQLEMLRLSLNLNTIAVLWPSPEGKELRLRYMATSRTDIDQGPYPIGTGITGALTADRDEVELVPLKPSHPALPYYRKQEGKGAAIALKIQTGDGEKEQAAPERSGILCLDRQLAEPWSDQEKQVLRQAAKKLALEVNTSRLLLNMDRERSSTHKLYLGLRELNSGLNLESVFAASVKAVKTQTPADLVAVSLLANDMHQIAMIAGMYSSELSDKEYPVSNGLVGQAIKTGKVLPAGGRYRGAVPIFSEEKSFANLGSLLIIPLRDKADEPMGALTVAAREEGVFNKHRQDILELIADQVAIKIELAQAHEKLSQFATTDGLTGLANHRAFQHGFDMMISRSKRSNDPLCLIMCDLDHFKSINDKYGHPFGDQVLQKVSAILEDAVRSVDLAARYGGEEFAMILEDCNTSGGHQLAERIREKIAGLTFWHDDHPVKVTISLGVAAFPEHAAEKSELIERTDQALYQAKRSGRNKVVAWSPGSTEER